MAPSAETLDRFYGFWCEWFAQPEAEKMRFLRSSGKGGYYPMGSEAPGYEAKADPKEYVHWRLGHSGSGWDDAFGSYGSTWKVFDACYTKARYWLKERGLQGVLDATKPEDCVLRIIRYPATPDGNVGQAHCDFDLLTVSVPGTVPGLEVFNAAECDGGDCGYPCHRCGGAYGHHAVPDCKEFGGSFACDCTGWKPRETFEVHVGEMLTHYAKIPATPHRVRTPPNTERFKAVFFYLPPMDFALSPGFTAHDYLLGPSGVLRKAGTA